MSDKPKGVGSYSIDKLVKDVNELAKALGSAKFHLVGSAAHVNHSPVLPFLRLRCRSGMTGEE